MALASDDVLKKTADVYVYRLNTSIAERAQRNFGKPFTVSIITRTKPIESVTAQPNLLRYRGERFNIDLGSVLTGNMLPPTFHKRGHSSSC